MDNVYLSIDESGTFGQADSYFTFSGYAILGKQQYLSKVRKYNQTELRIKHTDEIKAGNLTAGERKRLLAVMDNQLSFAALVDNDKLPLSCSWDKTSKVIVRDEVLKSLILEVLGKINLTNVSSLIIEIDEQNLTKGLKQNLYLELYKHLISGYYSGFDFVKPLIDHQIELTVIYVDSRKYSLVRAADILAYEVIKQVKSNRDAMQILKIFKRL
ncbi:DUF3800 domain-containing protein [Mollicutes bacterium LVI A0039]|nr:DUF3800 domain-containing protein [Mollicutes bacterium LVI A0039]